MNIWQFSAQVSARLLAWGTLSTLLGLLLLPVRGFWRGFGGQAVGWGVIDAGIALAGVIFSRRRRARMADSHAPEVLAAEARSLRRLLWINTGLDVFYMLGGAWWARRSRSAFGRGSGWGVVVQGAFLFIFDLFHALRVPPQGKPQPQVMLDLFSGDEHRPFREDGGKPAALFIHGFPGTPAEMCPLADALHIAGWTVEGILLPGFGSEIETLEGRTAEEWQQAARSALNALRATHGPVIVVGNSLGGALAVATAAAVPVDGLVLLNPFSRLRHRLWSVLPLLKLYVPSFNPFRLVPVDWNDPEVRRGAAEMMPDTDFDDPAVQRGIRSFSIPTDLLDQIRRAGIAAYRAAPLVSTPTLIVQGAQDTLVNPADTYALARRLGGTAEVVEVEATHNMLAPAETALPQVIAAVTRFADSVTGQQAQDGTQA